MGKNVILILVKVLLTEVKNQEINRMDLTIRKVNINFYIILVSRFTNVYRYHANSIPHFFKEYVPM
jgi:hypothetical protein